MNIGHVALWCRDIERVAGFWIEYFGAQTGPRYESTRRPGFVSRFIRLGDGVTLELMSAPWLADNDRQGADYPGWAHLAIAVGSSARVDELAERLRQAGALVSPPRHTGDGFYEAVVRDPEGNLVEIVE